MNQGTVTGGVVKGAVSAYTAPTKEQPSIRRVTFSIATRDGHGGDGFWNCESEGDEALLDFLEAEAQPGRGIKLDYELASRPYTKHGVHTGESRFLRVFAAEINGKRIGMPQQMETAS
jgi:hypothetical protein